MFRYVIGVNYLGKSIFIEDRATKTMHMFTQRSHYEPGTALRHREYPSDGSLQIVVPTYETNTNPIGDGCPYDIHNFDAFASGLKKTFGRKRK